MKTVIMAGGKGTRIRSVNAELPKPMIPILNKPILEHQLECLKKQGYTDITLIIGHMSEKITQYFGDGTGISPTTGSPFGIKINYIIEETPLGTAGAMFFLKERINDNILLLNGDVLFDVDLHKFEKFHIQKDALVTLFTHPNDHPFDSGLIEADEDNRVIKWLHKEDKRGWYKNRVNAGLHILSPEIFSEIKVLKHRDLDRDVLKPLISSGKIFVYDSPEYVKDMGTPERFASIEKDFSCGRIQAKNLANKQKAIFIDRDGTINKYMGFLNNINDFELLDGVGQAIKKINQSGYLAIVVTNQPVIARGDISWKELNEIHKKLETLLGNLGAYLDDIYICPHHPDKGYSGERPKYKMQCMCRKPAAGMLYEASKKYNIDLGQSWMIGDSACDIEAGIKAGCRTAYIGNNSKYKDVPAFNSLFECINNILFAV